MHMFGGIERDGKKITMKEGVREGREEGGIAGAEAEREDRRRQSIDALFKVRLYMTPKQWTDFKAGVLRGDPNRSAQEKIFEEVEGKFGAYRTAIGAELAGSVSDALDIVDDAEKTGMQQLEKRAALAAGKSGDEHVDEARAANRLMAASNRIYEERLETIAKKRQRLQTQIARYKGAQPQERATIAKEIDSQLVILRDTIAEASFYANEASITDAAVHHGVIGLQAGKEINQTKAEGINAVHEHMGDALKEIARHGRGEEASLGEAAYKAGKYMYRLGDAARNMGFGYIWAAQVMYDVGYPIAVTIKSDADSGKIDPHAKSVEVLEKVLGSRPTLAELTRIVIAAGTDVTQELQAEQRAEGADKVQKQLGYKTPKKNAETKKIERNVNVVNLNMVHSIDAINKVRSELEIAADKGKLEDFAFRLTPDEFAKLPKTWRAQKAQAAPVAAAQPAAPSAPPKN
jgi:hypothetical protein